MPHGILILAAGLGKRMKSPLPKVLHSICAEPLLFHILHCVKNASPDAEVGIIVGYGRDQVEAAVRGNPEFSSLKISFIFQSEQKGTGHAVKCAMDSDWGRARLKEKAPILVLPGDTPLIRAEMIQALLEKLPKGEVLRLLTIELPNPKGYGRVVRSGKGPKAKVLRIVEEKDASPKEKLIREVAASTYTFDSKFLADSLPKLKTKNAQGEYYLTDLVALAAKPIGKQSAKPAKKQMSVLQWGQAEDLSGINDLWELSQAERILRLRGVEKHAREGVRFSFPETNFVGRSVELAPGVTVGQGVSLQGKTRVGEGSTLGAFATLENATIGKNVEIKQGTLVYDSIVEDGAAVGPYAHLRPESHVGREAKIGNFVELKKTKIGEKTSVAHLSYLGDATVGARVNIGCGFVTCNYDGRVKNGQRKHATVIEDGAFIGSDCQTVAPVTIGKGAYVASGSTITKNVEPDALAIARSRQENKIGYAARLRPSKKES